MAAALKHLDITHMVVVMSMNYRLFFALFLALSLVAGVAQDAESAASCHGTVGGGATSQQLRIAITVDDLPFADQGLSIDEQSKNASQLLATLQKHNVPAIGFVNEDKLLVPGEVDERIGLLRAWLDAGMTLGNHGFGHLGLQKTALAEAESAVLKGEVVTRWLMEQYDMAPAYYRYPYNQTGPTKEVRDAFSTFLTRHGYTVAPFTIQNDDHVYDRVYSYDLQHGEASEARRVRKAYLSNLAVVLAAHEKMSEELFGHHITQIFDLHANAINADSIDSILDRLEDRGYCFVSLPEALKDPAYRSPDGYAGPYGMTWLRRWAKGLGGVKFSVYPPDPQAWVTERHEMLASKMDATKP